ncbi:hypothetical protein [Microbacterium sp. SLBN-146]|uniref:hypothetical protein n=1 Tax=Microbacterium sp. SLBN-146 TaxID=2768457 RepID=UPI001151E9BE|nr:hypothetical protein [Microbacterium sp. SLBN-146]TQJ31819.1 hypothetical protein FBY39_2303 [Microbacterium sp. SLBN-146]
MTGDATKSGVVRFCRSRSGGRRCTRPLGHVGLHRHRTIMWSDAGADDPRCLGSGTSATAAALLADGYPHGRALCPRCLRFIELTHGALVAHDTSDPDETDEESKRRAEWLNTHGW